jgi:hypothetical protein
MCIPLPSLAPDRRAFMAPSMQFTLDLLIAASWFLVFIYLPHSARFPSFPHLIVSVLKTNTLNPILLHPPPLFN